LTVEIEGSYLKAVSATGYREEDPGVSDWLRREAGSYGDYGNGHVHYAARGSSQSVTVADFVRGMLGARMGQSTAKYFIDILDGYTERLGRSLGSIIEEERELDASSMFSEVFEEGLVYDQVTGAFCLRVGKLAPELAPTGRFTDAYTEAMRQLPKLRDQGSGVRAFMGAIAALVVGRAQVLLMDEPETFLHPPQARKLGRVLGREAVARDRQLIMVTHDRDLVVGLLESDAPVTFIRVAREGGGNRLSHVNTGDVKWIWNKAILRYSNVLSGLFYRRVVVCESDADCRFYSAILDGLASRGEVSRQANETLFVPSVGKGGVADRVEALAKIHVSIGVILDIDILSDEPAVLKRIVGNLAGEWSDEDARDFNLVKQRIVDDSLKLVIKRSGVSALGSGPPYVAAQRLLARLALRGVFVVREGEMESFDRTLGDVKEPWVDKALAKGLHLTPGAHADLVRSAVGGVSSPDETSAF
jgi:hypothetical protein